MRCIPWGASSRILLILATLAGCAPNGAVSREEPVGGEAAVPLTRLATTLQAESNGDSVRFSLRVTNATDAPLPLTFPTGQSFDFVVEREGREVWRWSEDMMFTQAIREETLAPGETRSYSATWEPPAGIGGRLTVRGFLTAQQERAEQRTELHLP